MADSSMTEALNPESLDSVLEEILVGRPMPQGNHCLGIEMERFILHRKTGVSAPLDFCLRLLEEISEAIGGRKVFDREVLSRVDGDGYSFTMEPGGQLEVALAPMRSLAEIDSTMQEIDDLVEERIRDTPYKLPALGHAPVSRPEEIGLLPRDRYRIMDTAMISRGELTRNMMRATAGLQLTFDVESREDAGRKLALLQRIAPLMVAITANSRMVGGEDSGYESYRHHVWLHTDRDRVGIPEGGLRAETAIEAYKTFAKSATMLFLKLDDRLVAAPAEPLAVAVAEHRVTREDLDLHLSSLFPFVRLRNYLEVRFLDSVEWRLARSVLALLATVLSCPAATKGAEALSETLMPTDRIGLLDLHEDAARNGLEAVDVRGTSFRELARELLALTRAELGACEAGWAEHGDLDAVAELVQ